MGTGRDGTEGRVNKGKKEALSEEFHSRKLREEKGG